MHLNLEDGQVGCRVAAQDFGFIIGTVGKNHADLPPVANDVVVGYHLPIRAPNEARALSNLERAGCRCYTGLHLDLGRGRQDRIVNSAENFFPGRADCARLGGFCHQAEDRRTGWNRLLNAGLRWS